MFAPTRELGGGYRLRYLTYSRATYAYMPHICRKLSRTLSSEPLTCWVRSATYLQPTNTTWHLLTASESDKSRTRNMPGLLLESMFRLELDQSLLPLPLLHFLPALTCSIRCILCISVVFLSTTLQALNLRLRICVGDSETCINPLTTAGSIYSVSSFQGLRSICTTKYLAQPASPICCKSQDTTVASSWIILGPMVPSPLRANVRIPQAASTL